MTLREQGCIGFSHEQTQEKQQARHRHRLCWFWRATTPGGDTQGVRWKTNQKLAVSAVTLYGDCTHPILQPPDFVTCHLSIVNHFPSSARVTDYGLGVRG